jgi:hypothetical protein
MSPHVSAVGLPLNGALAQMTGAPPQQSPQITHTPSQPLVQPHKIPPLPEDRFKNVFTQFTAATGMRISERDLIVEGRLISLWALHRTVFMRNGFDSVRIRMNNSPWIRLTFRFRLGNDK